MTKAKTDEVVEANIKEMGLGDCAENKIGNWHLRGISSGEKKRLSISLEMVTDPLILLLDEPTTGLDSASAFFVARALRNIADEERIVICSIQQPSNEVFDLFDDLLLLSSGETVFLGEAKMAIEDYQVCQLNKNTNSSKWKQLRVLTHRSFINMYRDIGCSWLRIMLYVLSSISAGTLYFDIGYDNGGNNQQRKVCFIPLRPRGMFVLWWCPFLQ